ncbi:MAG: hypothetical protein WD960_14320 [Gemmatimonadota bacterium]
MHRIAILIVLLLPFGEGAGSVHPKDVPAAIVLRAAGESEAEGRDAAEELGVGTLLPAGEIPGEPGPTRLVLLLFDGSVVEASPGFDVPSPGPEAHPVFRVTRAHLSAPDPKTPAAQGNGTASNREGAETAAPIRPTGEHQVRSLTPRMVWHAVEGAEGYRIRLTVSEEEVLTLDAGADTVYTIPVEAALPPGGRFEWSVAALPGEASGPSAVFSVASRELLDEVAGELSRLRGMGLDPEGEGLLVAAALFRSLRLPYDALAALEALEARGDPWSPELVRFHDRIRAGL